jgi:hypothetical protein
MAAELNKMILDNHRTKGTTHEFRREHYTEAVALYEKAIMMDGVLQAAATRPPRYWNNL